MGRTTAIKVHFPLQDGRGSCIDLAAALHVGGISGAIANAGPEEHKYDQLNREATDWFTPVDWDEAEVAVYPYEAVAGEEVDRVAAEARRRGIGCIFLSWGDADRPVAVSYGTVYRHSMFADTRLPNEEAMPAEVSDPWIELGQPIAPRDKRDQPTVGFCGFVSNPLFRAAYRATGRKRKADALAFRARVLRAVNANPAVQCRFILRQSYWAGTRSRFHYNAQAQFTPRMTFWKNVTESDYTVCVRGAGNFSYRFYEVLAAGRIPLFINTKCVLPFDDQIDWRQHCVWVEEDQLSRAGEILMDFHSRMSNSQFRQLQLSNRALWESKLSPLGFFRSALARACAKDVQAPLK